MTKTDKALEGLPRYEMDGYYYPCMKKRKSGVYVKAASAAKKINKLLDRIAELEVNQ